MQCYKGVVNQSAIVNNIAQNRRAYGRAAVKLKIKVNKLCVRPP